MDDLYSTDDISGQNFSNAIGQSITIGSPVITQPAYSTSIGTTQGTICYNGMNQISKGNTMYSKSVMSINDLVYGGQYVNGPAETGIEMILSEKVSESFLRSLVLEPWFPKESWDTICRTQELSFRFIYDFKDKVNWKILSERRIFTEAELSKFESLIDWETMSKFGHLTTREITKYAKLGKIDFSGISCNLNIKFSKFMLDKYSDRLDWLAISHLPMAFSNSFIYRYGDKPGFDVNIASSYCLDLTERTIFKYLTKINFSSQYLFMRKFKDDRINCYLKLSGKRD